MIKSKNINTYNYKIRANKVYNRTAGGPYRTTHDVKVPFSMPMFSRINVLTHRFHVDNARDDEGIVYDIIIGRGIMVQLGLKGNFNVKY